MQKRTDFFDNSLSSIVPDIPLVIRNKPHNNQLCADLSRLISAYPVVSHFLRFAWQTTAYEVTIMTHQTEYKENLSQEEIESLASVLMTEIAAFYKTERGKRFWEEYLRKKEKETQKTA